MSWTDIYGVILRVSELGQNENFHLRLGAKLQHRYVIFTQRLVGLSVKSADFSKQFYIIR